MSVEYGRIPLVANGRTAATTAVTAAGSVLGGVLIAWGYAAPVLAVLVLLCAFLVGVWRWRWSVYALLVYLPFSGIPILAAVARGGDRAAALLAKDFLFVLPAYVGFAVWALRRRERPALPAVPLTLLALLALVVVVQALNPPNFLAALIGTKVWLFYVPLVALGYHLVDTRRRLIDVLGLMTLVALVPAAIGIAQGVLLIRGHADLALRLYGDAAAAATQQFTRFEFAGGGTLHRVPSTFSYVSQYYMFVAAMLVVSYAWWRASHRRVLGATVWIVLLGAAFLSGQRGAFVFVPLLVALLLASSVKVWQHRHDGVTAQCTAAPRR